MSSYREFVGWPEGWDILSAMQFNLLTYLGLREDHYLLDIGCGSLRTGRLLIPYLQAGHYFGIEPEKWLVEEGIKNECGQDLVALRKPSFIHTVDFDCSSFGLQFDFVIAHSIFTHASQGQIRACLTQVRNCMKPDCVLAASYMKGDIDYDGEAWVYPDCITYTPQRMSNLAAEVGLRCHPVDWYHRNQSLILVTLPGCRTRLPRLLPNLERTEALLDEAKPPPG
jgi:cyclopropane fatty-acyl-phospholipid synthase-like methyltransferase